MLASSQSNTTSNQPKVLESQECRSSLLYGQYEWSVSWFQTEITVLRQSLDADQVAQALGHRKHYEKVRWDNNISLLERRLRPTWKSAITRDVETNIDIVRSWLVNVSSSVKTVFFHDGLVIYTNDRSLIDSAVCMVKAMNLDTDVRVRQALITKLPNVVYLKKPYDYLYRTYFRNGYWNDSTVANIKAWVQGMGQQVRLCPSFDAMLQGRISRWHAANCVWDHYFIDHNDPRLETWLAMISPGCVRKTMSIVSGAK